MNKFVFLIFPFLMGMLAFAQAPATQMANQSLPAEVVTSSTEKYRDMVAEMEANGARGREKKVKRQFYLETSFVIDDLLQSGLVLFSDSINEYFHAIMRPVIKGDQAKFLSEVKFFILRSPIVNAFAAPNGMVFVNIGLLARVENEAQLAYILAHELTHISHKHALNLLLNAKGITARSGSDELVSRSGFESSIVEQRRYNRDLEIQADEKAALQILDSKYDVSTLDQVFDILKYSESPYDNIPFFKSFLENENIIFPDRYFKEAVDPLEGEDENDDDESSTHPSLGKRRNLARTTFGRVTNASERSAFLVSEAQFMALRERARYELPALYLHRHRYQEAFYNAYLLLIKHEGDPYARLMMGKALFGLASFLNSSDEDTDAEGATPSDVTGEMQQVYHLLSKIRAEELTVLATNLLWQYYRDVKEDGNVKLMIEELLTQLKQEHQLGYTAFSATPKPVAAPSVSGVASDKTSAKKEENSDFHLYAFGPTLNDPRLAAMFARADSLAEARKKRQDWYASAEGRKASEKQNKTIFRKGAHLDIHSLVVVNPYYLRVDARKENAVQYIESENGEMEFLRSIKQAATLCKADIQILDPLLMEAGDVQSFNDMVTLNEWVSEQVAFGSMPLPGYQQAKINAIADRYNTDYFLWTGVVAIREQKDATAVCMNTMYMCMLPPFLPVFLYNIVKPEYETIYYAVLFNTRTGAWQEIARVNLPNDDKKWFVHQQLYDTFNQITKK